MKKLILPGLVLSCMLISQSCTKQYNENPLGPQNNNGSNTGGTGGSGGSGGSSGGGNSNDDGSDPNDNTNWNWTGTAPLSVKHDGTLFQAARANVYLGPLGGYIIATTSGDGITLVTVFVPTNATPGKVYTMPSQAYNLLFQSSPFVNTISAVGKTKVITNNATTLEGYFWSTMKSNPGQADTTIVLTEGYFKVDKP